MNKKGTTGSIFLVLLGILTIFGIVGICIYFYVVDYQYEKQIGSYFDNARDCITPECILIQLQSGKQAIVNAGLTNDLYGAWIFKKPDNSMIFQYQHLDAIIERAEAVKQWKEQVYSNNSVGETMKDVYNEKMDNLRKYIHSEDYRSDWIAKKVWYLKNHFVIGWFGIWIVALLLILAAIFFIIAFGSMGY